MRLKHLLIRLLSLRITIVWMQLYHAMPCTSRPHQNNRKKHIKIDDEESQHDAELDSYSPIHAQRSVTHTLRMLLLILLTLIILVFLLAYTIYKPPNLLISLLQHHSPSVLYHVPLTPQNKTIALTIDDAPSPYTSRILDLLAAHNAKATFFIIGSQVSLSPSYPALLQRMRDEGHELGNHAWSDEPSISLPLSELARQISDVEALLPSNVSSASSNPDERRVATHQAKYFRPGSGIFNSGMLKLVEGLGYKLVLGSVYPHDPQIHNPTMNAKHVLSMVRPGAIVIMHDRRDYSIRQLELVLEGLGKGGWGVENVGGLLRVAESIRIGRGNDEGMPD